MTGTRPVGSRYAPPSKATPTTLCQKCLKRGHYSYECTAKAQERPYSARPSRTQQLLDPKLKPKLSSDEPNPLLRKSGIADEQLAKLDEERAAGKGRSASVSSGSSSSSVSTISTNMSRSPSQENVAKHRKSKSPTPSRQLSRSRSVSRSPPTRDRRKTRHNRSSRRRSRSRSPARKDAVGKESRRHRSPSRTPPRRHRRRKSPMPDADDRYTESKQKQRSSPKPSAVAPERRPPPRERSLSPYSKRLAMTQAMNRGRDQGR